MIGVSVIVVLFAQLINAYIENSVIGVPKVVCEENDLALDIVTAQPFNGNIFVKGRAKEQSCKQSYTTNNSNSYSLSLGKCGMQRLRSVNPRGINFMITVIISFHPSGFITKNDRAFHVKCFYMEPDTVVTSSINVSPLLTTELSDTLKMPTCEYSVRRDSINGPQLTFANVGDTVFHVWHCSGAEMGMLVKKCYVTDGAGEEHSVIDPQGCSIDDYLLGELVYDKALMHAYAQSQVFKYADSNQLFFTCQIQLCQKAIGYCDQVTPPNCSTRNNRSKRALNRKISSLAPLEIDVRSPEFLIGGLDDSMIQTDDTKCFSPFLLALSNFVLFTLLTVIISLSLVLGKRTQKVAGPMI